jgi:hypothetical protein
VLVELSLPGRERAVAVREIVADAWLHVSFAPGLPGGA